MKNTTKTRKERIVKLNKAGQRIIRPKALQGQLARPQSEKIQVSEINVQWQSKKGICTFDGLPVAMMWVDTTLAGVMSGVQSMVGTERFGLALQSEGRKSVEEDWKVISQFKNFKNGFKAIANIAAVAGWGEWKLVSFDENKKTCVFRIKNSWEGRYQRALGVCWGSGMLAGKMAGYCSKFFGTNCWAKQCAFIAQGDKYDEFIVKPSRRSIEKEIENLLSADKATRADMAVALEKLRKEIAERRRVEEVLHKSEERFRVLTESTSDWIWEIDQNGVYTYASPKVKDLLGYEPHEIIGKTPFDFMPDDELQRLSEIYHSTVEFRKPFIALENINLHKDGRRIVLETSGVPILDKYGNFLGYRGIDRDISERKRAGEALMASEEKYRLLFENASDAIFVAQDEMIKFSNLQLSLLTGYSYEELTNIPFRNFIYPEDADMVVERHKKRLQGYDMPGTYSFRAITKSGDILWVEVSKVLITWEGRPATLTFLRNITQQKKLEAQLLQAQKMEAIGQLAGGVAHDFNNLLTAIIGYGHLLKNEAGQDARTSAFIGHILNAAERAAILTNDLLTFSRKQIINPQPVNLNEIIKDMESLLLRVIGEDIELSTVLTDADLTVMADSTQIDQILMNLAINAQDVMPNGGRFIISTDRMEINGDYIKAYGYGKPGSYALLSVEDTGTGMDENIRERIFEPFFTTKEVGKGTGLGLSMVYGIVKQHDGHISVYSEPGRGTAFKILLPLIESKAEETKPDTLIKVKGGTETILIGEDDPQVRILLKEVLSKAGYHVIEAIDGTDAVEVFHKHKDTVHLLILDIIMPKKNGKEAYEEIKKVKSDTKAIFVSGYSADVIHKKGILEVGLNFISKPVSPEELLITVRDVLDK
jgi:two-component system, cell cycle sensor histidine kinase and response regulator CckA